MKCVLDVSNRRAITEARRILFPRPVYHPTRLLPSHVIFYNLCGDWTISLEPDGGECEYIHAKKDIVVTLPARVLHRGIDKCTPGTQTMFLVIPHIEGDGYTDSDEFEKGTNKLCFHTQIDAAGNKNIKNYFENTLYAHMQKDTIRAFAWLDLLLSELRDASRAVDPQALLADRIKYAIDRNLCSNYTIGDIAKELNRSTRNVEILFKKHYGMTIHQYSICERIKKAKILLDYFPDRTLRDIAEELNFSDEYHLSRRFKQYYGVSPNTYRKELLQNHDILLG